VKALGIAIMVLALVIVIVPQFSNCEAQGGTMPVSSSASFGRSGGQVAAVVASTGQDALVAALSTGVAPKMRCFWSARAEIAVGIPLFAVGVLLLLSRRKETRRALAALAVLLGLGAILVPTALIGVCASDLAICQTTMDPTLFIAGGLTMAVGLTALVVNELRGDGRRDVVIA
jgi:hypothetical protein